MGPTIPLKLKLFFCLLFPAAALRDQLQPSSRVGREPPLCRWTAEADGTFNVVELKIKLPVPVTAWVIKDIVCFACCTAAMTNQAAGIPAKAKGSVQ